MHIGTFRTQTSSITIISEQYQGTLIIYSVSDSLGRLAVASQCIRLVSLHQWRRNQNSNTNLVGFLRAPIQMLQEPGAGTLMNEDEIGASVAEMSRRGGSAPTETTTTAHEEGVDGQETTSYDLPLTRGSHGNGGGSQTRRSCNRKRFILVSIRSVLSQN